MAQLAADTIASVAARVPDDALRPTFLGWRRVAEALESAEHIRRR
jgi:hypothetical protein